jgi:hypothetical protein
MPILAYCMTEPAFSMQAPLTGVGGAAVRSVEAGGVRCFFSRVAADDSSTRARDGALAFHSVLQEIFSHTAILPFRFPTVLEDEAELTSLIQERALEYQEALVRLRDLVQMEIRITLNQRKPQAEAAKVSGKQYLDDRLAQQRRLDIAAESIRNGAASLLKGWRKRESGDGLRCFMLLGRGYVSQLQTKLTSVQISGDLSVRVSGPWPATEFVKKED